MDQNGKIRVLLYSKQPFVSLGLARALRSRQDFKLTGCCETLPAVLGCLRPARPDVLLLYITGQPNLLELHQIRVAATPIPMVLWGHDLNGELAFQTMQMGVRGILPGETSVDGLLDALHNVHRGVLCCQREVMEDALSQARVTLTRRQRQIVSLVARGMKNKEIGAALGITEGTVKYYLYRLYKKLGIDDRLNMALYGMKNQIHHCGASLAVEGIGPLALPANIQERTGLHIVN